MKTCRVCTQDKPIEFFKKHNNSKSGYDTICKKCSNEWNRLYRQLNKKRIGKYWKNYLVKIKETEPWKITYMYIKSRCNSKITPYFRNGIKNKITKEELRKLWFRDRAYLMDKPSINRRDTNKDYYFDNCEYVEYIDNIRKVV